MLNILDRYILKQLFWPFIMGVAGFVVINLVNTLYLFAELIVNSGVPVMIVAKMLALNLPAIMVITFPVAYLFATLLVIGRLSRDSEVTAMRSIGLSFNRILLPVLLGAVVVSGVNFVLSDRTVPWANKRFVDLIRDSMLHQGAPILKENIFFKGPGEERYFYVRQVDRRNNHMYDVFISDRRDGQSKVIVARDADWVGNFWRLRDGVLSRYDQWGSVTQEDAFSAMDIKVTINPEAFFASGDRSPQEKSSQELKTEIDALKGGGTDTKSMEVDYYMKFSLPLSTFFAVLLGAPLGARFSRMGGYVGVVFSILLVFIYYVVMVIARTMGNTGLLDPVTGAWAPDYLFGVLGLFFLWRIDR